METLNAVIPKSEAIPKERYSIDWLGAVPFIGLHLGCLLVIVAGWSPIALAVALTTYVVRGLCITAGYHRYFSHRSYKTGRLFQFLMGLVGTMAVQMGPLWWACHHRNHHRYSDTDKDPHSPIVKNFWWSHIGWVMDARSYRNVDTDLVSDFAKYPELRWLDRWCLLPPIALAAGLWGLGSFLETFRPEWGTSGLQLLTWGFFISTVAVHHVTFSVNSVAHVFGSQRFKTRDQSRNNALLALITMGEGWHNNHHRFPFSERQGIYWWEVDITHGVLKVLSWFGIVRSLRETSKAMADNILMTERTASIPTKMSNAK